MELIKSALHLIHAHVLMDGLDPIVIHVCLITSFDLKVMVSNFYCLIKAICSPTCGTNKECILPDTCTCDDGWAGSNCDIGCSSVNANGQIIYVDFPHRYQ